MAWTIRLLTIALLVAIGSEQIDYSKVTGWEQFGVRSDHTIYWKGTYRSGGGERTVYAGLAARMGMPAAVGVASKMIHWFRPRFLCMTGIAAGIRGRIQLGDVIVADPCWDWGSGKWAAVESASKFAAAPYQIGLAPWLRERVRLIAADDSWLTTALQRWPGNALTDRSRLHVGPLASGASVLADGATAARVLEQNRQLLGIEMEAYGVFAAADEAPAPRPQAFVMKAVVDFADGKKDDRFQALGAYLAAASLQHFAELHL